MGKIDTIGFIGGGRMAEALIQGIIQAGLAKPDKILVADPDANRRELLHAQYKVNVSEQADVVLSSNFVILAVKPQILVDLLDHIKSKINASHLLVSIAAGIPLQIIEEKLAGSGCRVVRVMPNTPALVLEGASALSAGTLATAEDLEKAKAVFDAVGTSVVLEEKYLDAVTGLSGSGPAYVFSFMEALIDSGVKVGLSRPVAESLVFQTVLGSVKLAMDSDEHPAQLRAMVTSPGGTTIAALHEMEKAGFNGIIMDAIEAATNRSKELGNLVLAENNNKK